MENDQFTEGLRGTGRFQDHPDGTLATDMTMKETRSLAYTLPDPTRVCVARCRDGVVLAAPARTARRLRYLRARAWKVQELPGAAAVIAWRAVEPKIGGAWRAVAADAARELLARMSGEAPQSVLGVVARHGGGGVDEVALVLSPAAGSSAESSALTGGDIESGGRTFLVDAFRGAVPAGFVPVASGDTAPGDPSESASAAGDLPEGDPAAE